MSEIPEAPMSEVDGHPLFALALGTALGALVTHVLSRFCPKVPYTPTLLLLGVLAAVIKRFALSPEASRIFASLDEWENIEGHLVLLVFLPPLLFVDTIHLEWHRTYRCLGQCILLAGPGVLLSAGLTAVYVRFVLPYDWDWNLALAFGSVLAATDPVAVVALLNELGAPPVLTMVIAGESMLNDGSAIVIWEIFFGMYLGEVRASGAGRRAPVLCGSAGWHRWSRAYAWPYGCLRLVAVARPRLWTAAHRPLHRHFHPPPPTPLRHHPPALWPCPPREHGRS